MTEHCSLDQINHYLWRRQGFDRLANPLPRPVIEQVIGIYATSPTCTLGLLARDDAFQFAELDAFLEARHAVRIRAMRYSNFLIPTPLLPAVYQATKDRALGTQWKLAKLAGVEQEEYPALADAIEQLLDAEPLTSAAVRKALPPEFARFSGALTYVLPYMCAELRLVRTTSSGGWKSDQYRYARTATWLPDLDVNSATPEVGRVIVARHYFDSYGPATVEDFLWWSGFTRTDGLPAIEALGEELVPITSDDAEYLALASTLDNLRAAPAEAPSGVALLPVWDAYLMAYKDRTRYLSKDRYAFVYDKVGNGTSSLLIDGVIAGVWDFEESKKTLTVKVALFADVPPETWDALAQETTRLAHAAGYDQAALHRCTAPLPLDRGSQNVFKSPLKDVPGEAVWST
jgi:hypothetical protein